MIAKKCPTCNQGTVYPKYIMSNSNTVWTGPMKFVDTSVDHRGRTIVNAVHPIRGHGAFHIEELVEFTGDAGYMFE